MQYAVKQLSKTCVHEFIKWKRKFYAWSLFWSVLVIACDDLCNIISKIITVIYIALLTYRNIKAKLLWNLFYVGLITIKIPKSYKGIMPSFIFGQIANAWVDVWTSNPYCAKLININITLQEVAINTASHALLRLSAKNKLVLLLLCLVSCSATKWPNLNLLSSHKSAWLAESIDRKFSYKS